MPEYDGSIKLGVELDAETVKKSSSGLKSEIADIFKQSAGKEVSAEFQKLQTQMDKAVTNATNLENKLDDLKSVETPEYAELIKELNEATDSMEKLNAEKQQLTELGLGEADSQVQNLNQRMIETKNVIDGIMLEMTEMENANTAYTVDESKLTAYENLKNQLANVNNQMRILASAAYDTGQVVDNSGRTAGVTWSNAGKLIKQTFNDIKSGAIFKTIGEHAKSAAKKMSSAFKSAGSKVKDALTNLKNHSSKSFSSMGNNIKSTIKHFLAMGIGITSIVMLFRKIRAAATEGLQAMALMNGGNNSVNQSISSLISSLNYLKASLATAFAPILSVVAPILSAFVDMLARAAQMVGAFFAALTGKGTYTAATKVNTNYAASISKSTGKTKNDTKETKKNTKAKKDNAKATKDQNDKLASFDDLNVLGVESQDDLNDALEEQPQIETPEIETPEAGGGGGTPLAGFEEKDIPGWINDLVNKIKEAWAKADFTEIGRMVGEKLRDALNSVSDWLVDVAQPIAEKLGKSIATFLNGFFETPGLADALGRTLGELVNTAVIGMNAFLDNTHWDSIGKFIADGLNSAIKTIDWAAMGHMFAQGLNAMFGLLSGFVKNFDFRGLGNAFATGFMQMVRDIDVGQIASSWSGLIAGAIETVSGLLQGINWIELGEILLQWVIDAVTNVDWARLTSAWAELLGSAIGALAGFVVGLGLKLWEIIQAAWDLVVQWFNENAIEDGKFTIEGFLKGILEAIKNIGNWIYNNIFKPFIDGFCKAFGIASPSTVMKEQGGFLMEGLFIGIKELLAKIIELFTTLKNWIIEKWNALKEKFLEITDAIRNKAVEIWNSLKSTVENFVSTLKTNVINFVTNLKEKFLELTEGLRTKAIEIWTNIKEKIEEFVTKLKENVITFVTALRDKVLEIFGNVKSKALEIWENIRSEVERIVGLLKKAVVDTISKLYDAILGKEGWLTKLKTNFIKIWEDVSEGIKKPIEAIGELFKSIGTAAKDGINAAIDAINGLQIKIPDWVPGFGGAEWSPNIPRLAEGAVIPPNREFLAVLGDQKQGTNIEAPLDTIVQAMQMALSSSGAQNSSQNAIMTLDGQTFARLIVPHVMDELNRRGYDVSVLEG